VVGSQGPRRKAFGHCPERIVARPNRRAREASRRQEVGVDPADAPAGQCMFVDHEEDLILVCQRRDRQRGPVGLIGIGA